MTDLMLNFSYQGDRDYIDISLICGEFFAAIEKQASVEQMKDLSVTVRKPIKHHCRAVLRQGLEGKEESCAEVSFSYDNKKICYDLIPTERLITDRISDPQYSFSPPQVSENAVSSRLQSHDPKEVVYMYMKMAREFVVKHYDANGPRAVTFSVDFLPLPKKTAAVFEWRVRFPARKGFQRFEAFYDGEAVGYGIVKYQF